MLAAVGSAAVTMGGAMYYFSREKKLENENVPEVVMRSETMKEPIRLQQGEQKQQPPPKPPSSNTDIDTSLNTHLMSSSNYGHVRSLNLTYKKAKDDASIGTREILLDIPEADPSLLENYENKDILGEYTIQLNEDVEVQGVLKNEPFVYTTTDGHRSDQIFTITNTTSFVVNLDSTLQEKINMEPKDIYVKHIIEKGFDQKVSINHLSTGDGMIEHVSDNKYKITLYKNLELVLNLKIYILHNKVVYSEQIYKKEITQLRWSLETNASYP